MRHPSPLPAGPGQESVWDYPRPAVCEPFTGLLRVELDGVVVAETTAGFRVLETSHPPSYYLPAVVSALAGQPWTPLVA